MSIPLPPSFVRLLIFSAAISLTGCVAEPPRMVQTASGNPEVVIAVRDAKRVQAWIIGEMANHGYALDRDSEFVLQFSRPATPAENLGVGLTIGNAYSSNRRVETYTIVPVDGGFRVIVAGKMVSQMVGGQENSAAITANAVFNVYEQDLQRMKAELEAKNS